MKETDKLNKLMKIAKQAKRRTDRLEEEISLNSPAAIIRAELRLVAQSLLDIEKHLDELE